MDFIKTIYQPYIWHWRLVIKEVSNNYYSLIGTGPKGEVLTLLGSYVVNELTSKMIVSILEQSPERSKYPEYYDGEIVDGIRVLKNLSYRFDISYE